MHSECPAHTDIWNISWPSTVTGGFSSQLCPNSQGENTLGAGTIILLCYFYKCHIAT